MDDVLPHVRVSPTPLRRFQVIGERCSGTNYVRSVISANTGLQSVPLAGWKHGFPTFAALPDDFLLIWIVRDAFDWAKSLFKRPWHASEAMRQLDFSTFIREPWEGIVDEPVYFNLPAEEGFGGQVLQYDRHPITGLPFESIAALRNTKHAAWRGLRNRRINIATFRLEDWKGQEAERLSELAEAYDIALNGAFQPTNRHLGFTEEWGARARMLRERGWQAEFDRNDQAVFFHQLDLAQEAALGYRYTLPTA